MTRIPLALVDQHVDAVRAIAREHTRADISGIAGALMRRLREVTDEFLRAENSDRPDYLESIFAPPLAPGAGLGIDASLRRELRRFGLLSRVEGVGHQLVAKQPRLLARRLGGEAAQ